MDQFYYGRLIESGATVVYGSKSTAQEVHDWNLKQHESTYEACIAQEPVEKREKGEGLYEGLEWLATTLKEMQAR